MKNQLPKLDPVQYDCESQITYMTLVLKALGYSSIPWNYKTMPNTKDPIIEDLIPNLEKISYVRNDKETIINEAFRVSKDLGLYDANEFVKNALIPSLGYPS